MSGCNQVEASRLLGMPARKLNRLETHQLPTRDELRVILDMFTVRDRRPFEEMYEAARTQIAWWHSSTYGTANCRYAAAEDDASSVTEFSLGIIPDLLQTPDYSQALRDQCIAGADPTMAGRRLDMVPQRQARLFDRTRPPLRLQSIVHESVLYQGVSRTQLSRLIELARLPHVVLQVLPQSRGLHAGLTGSMILLRSRSTSSETSEKSPPRPTSGTRLNISRASP